MKRVLHITNIPTPYRVPQLNAMSRQFSEIGWQLKVVFGESGYGRRQWAVDLAECEFEHQILAGALTRADAERTVFLYRGLNRVLRAFRPDVVISTGYSIATLKVMVWSMLYHAPYLIFSGSIAKGSGRRTGLRSLERRVLIARAAGAVAYGSLAKDYLMSLGMPEPDIRVAINTVDVSFFRERTSEIREAAGPTVGRQRTLLYIGDLTRRKRPEAALRLAARLAEARDDFRLVMVGDGRERQPLERLCRELSIEPFVRFEGFRQKAELPYYLAAADCFLFPTRYDIWGLVLNEAMAAGVPCVASVQAGATADLIQQGVTGFAADFEDIDDVSRHVIWILDHPAEAAEMGRRASDYVAEHAGIERSAAGFVDAVLHAAVRHPARSRAAAAPRPSREPTALIRGRRP